MTGFETAFETIGLDLPGAIPAPLWHLHGQQDGCIAPVPEDLDRRWFAARDHRVVPNAGHLLFQEVPHEMAARVAAWLA